MFGNNVYTFGRDSRKNPDGSISADLIGSVAMNAPAELVTVNLDEVTKTARKVVDAVDKANTPKEPTDDQLRAEWSTLEQQHRELEHYAAQSEASTNAQSEHVRVIEKRLKAAEALIPADILETTLAAYQKGGRVYRHVAACRGILALREIFDEAKDIFARKRRIGADWAARKKAFAEHNLPRLLELREIIKKQDNDYAVSHGRKSIWQF